MRTGCLFWEVMLGSPRSRRGKQDREGKEAKKGLLSSGIMTVDNQEAMLLRVSE